MGTNFNVNIPSLRESAGQYKDLAKNLTDYITHLETVNSIGDGITDATTAFFNGADMSWKITYLP